MVIHTSHWYRGTLEPLGNQEGGGSPLVGDGFMFFQYLFSLPCLESSLLEYL